MGAAALTAGSLIAKAIGALYRIPLTNILGAEGLGLYQTVFPLYALLLSLSTSGIPSAVCSVTATHFKERGPEGANEVKREAMRLLKKIGFVASFLPALLCVPLSALLNAPDLWLAFLSVSPAVFCVCLISGYRGYLQGMGKMTPTAISQIAEQAVKAGISLPLAYALRHNITLAVTAVIASIALSELAALLILAVISRKQPAT